MGDNRLGRFRCVDGFDPLERLWEDLPPLWRVRVIDPGIEGRGPLGPRGVRHIHLDELSDAFAIELAWMAHWQFRDGTRCSVQAINQLATMLRRARRENHPVPVSLRAMDWDTASALQGWYYATRWGRLPSGGLRKSLRILTRFARLALIARCHDGPWWQLDEWHPRCDPRIPMSPREPQANYGCSPGRMVLPWLREAVKWHLGTMLEAGTLRWATASQERMACLVRFDRWLSVAFDNPSDVLGDPATAGAHAAAFGRWVADPLNRRSQRLCDRRYQTTTVDPRLINDDLRAVAELFAFVTTNRAEAARLLGSSCWHQVSEAHAASWFRQVSRIPHRPELNAQHYVDDHALAQIPAALPLLGLAREEQMQITRRDGTQVLADGFDDPQAMRMILLQILTGRRVSEIRTCAFDCLSPVPARSLTTTQGEEVARFHYAQSKIDGAPDHILVDREATVVIAEQQQWVRDHFPEVEPRYLFVQRTGNRCGDKPYPQGSYSRMLREFSDLVSIVDSTGRALRLSHTHRFRHTRLTRLAELGLPIKVLQRYAGHATPTMSMYYVAQREEHAEQAFLATAKLKADGTQVEFSPEDHDSLHLLNRADRFLPHGWCLLPPLQTCDKGNACLTCPMFATTAEFLPQHRAQRQQLIQIISAAEARGQARLVEMNQQVLGNLDQVINALDDENQTGEEVADAC